MKIVAMLRVKNEARWIAQVLRSLQPLCHHIYVMDDHSDDHTAGICATEGAAVFYSPFKGFDETRDKNWLMIEVLKREIPDWIVMIDGDEILAEGSHAAIIKHIRMIGHKVNALTFEVLYLWNDMQHVRTDLRTFCRRRASMFKPTAGALFASPYPTHGLHCGNVPHGYSAAPVEGARLLHLGYMNREDRLRKWEWYNKLDPANFHEDCYRHMIIGDTPDLPAESVTKWGGPLKLELL